MIETPAIVKKLNRRLGEVLGLNPHGKPLYKWVYSEDFFHWMQDVHIEQNSENPNDIRTVPKLNPVTQPSGLVLMEPSYSRRKVCPNLEDVWLVAHWNDCGSEASWRIRFGSKLMWPREGMYAPVNAWTERGQLPTEDLTDFAIKCVRQIRDEKELKRLEEAAQFTLDTKDRDDERNRKAILDEIQTGEFGVPAGSRDGSVSFPLPGVDYAAPFTTQ